MSDDENVEEKKDGNLSDNEHPNETPEERKKRKEKEKKKKKKEKEKDKKKKETEDDGKKKKKGGASSLLKEMLKLRQEEEERQRQAEEEAKRLAEEEEKLRKEAEAAEKLKKEEQRKQKEELIALQKKEGTFLTKKQRQQQAQAQARLLQNNDIVLPPGLRGETPDEGKPKKPPVYGQRKRKPKPAEEAKKVEEPSPTPEPEPKPEPTPEPEKPESPEVEDEDVVDDWEQIEVEVKPKELKAEKADKPKASASKQKEKAESSSEEESDSESDEDSSEGESEEEEEDSKENKAKVRERLEKRAQENEAKRTTDNLRSPVICVLGHVDTGKTKMLDTIRRTNVQDGEAGGITQQIGATRVPTEAIKERCKMVRDFKPDEIKIPGFLIIDTPGHESFANLRTRGSSLCDFAILVVDVMHGLEPQTIESLKLLLKRKTPFVIALNKVDRLYGYESNPRKDIWQHLKSQAQNVQLEFKERFEKIVVEFAEQGVNVALAKDNKNPDEYVSIVPTSAFLGDGIGNIMAFIVNQSQGFLAKRLAFSEELDCTVMEVRSLPGLGMTIDVILVNGTLKINDIIILSGVDGPIGTTVRDLLMPAPLREIRVKTDYEHYKEIKGAQGVKILAKNLEKALPGLPIYVAQRPDEVDVYMEDAKNQLENALMAIKKKPEGVYVQASTLGSLEALLDFLKHQKIPYSGVNIGPVHRKDVQKASTMHQHNEDYAVILAFDVPVDREAQALADKERVRIFQADIIYHLEDAFLNHREQLRLQRKKANEHLAIFPCILRIMPQHIFNARNPIVLGVVVEAGKLKKGTPICAKTADEIVLLGTVTSIEQNHEQVDVAHTGDELAIKIENTTGDAPKLYGRHFTHTDPLVSRIHRQSIDVCKTHFRDEMSNADWTLIVRLKKMLNVL
ncbi:unnamed protein product [Bursaphelenchus okinawaensis]|uniref:Eukaryotic translation initiation factor 5B n=1 Tax=Bursaphelenchus okinawaensis TaxID=465554 RepID=A0A811KE75_9BILA|nr:unnamed protein product [Bursaphelenchus okinawaensis]CAG9101969.1 unnamed protein product [Bursaphelenchus okinawaensis]